MILVIGETIVDLVSLNRPHSFSAHLGGSPFNVAVGLSKLGSPVGLVTGISQDTNGARFRSCLQKNGIHDYSSSTHRPSSVAWALKDENQNAHYSFYLDGTSLLDITFSPRKKTKKNFNCVFYGSIASYWSGLGEKILNEIKAMKVLNPSLLVAYDPNIRADLITNRKKISVIKKHLNLTDIVKMSDQDFNFIFRKESNQFEKIAQSYLRRSAKLFIITLGAEGCIAFNSRGSVKLSKIPTNLVDTIGAGDCFTASVLHSITNLPNLTPEKVRKLEIEDLKPILHRSLVAASLNCEKKGASPPTSKQLEQKIKMLGFHQSRN